MDEKRFAIKETVSVEEVKMLRKKLGLTQERFCRTSGLFQTDCRAYGT